MKVGWDLLIYTVDNNLVSTFPAEVFVMCNLYPGSTIFREGDDSWWVGRLSIVEHTLATLSYVTLTVMTERMRPGNTFSHNKDYASCETV